jgi:DNA-directed RNA polymerase subunit K/omega
MKSVKKTQSKKQVEETTEEPIDQTEEIEEIDEIEENIDEPNGIDEPSDINLQTEDVVDSYENCIEIDEPQFLKDDIMIPVVDSDNRTSKNKMTRYEFVRIKGERIMQLSKGAKPLIRKNKQSEELTYKEIAIEEIKTNMVPFKIKRFVKDHYEIWKIEELDKKHLEPLFH